MGLHTMWIRCVLLLLLLLLLPGGWSGRLKLNGGACSEAEEEIGTFSSKLKPTNPFYFKQE
jgi:hypothetical protein